MSPGPPYTLAREPLRRLAPVAWLARLIYHVVPDLSAFDVKMQVVHGLPVSAGYLGMACAYGLLYIAAILLVSTFVFSRRDFK